MPFANRFRATGPLTFCIGFLTLLSGCIYLTPPTGLRLGNHEQEFYKPPRFLRYEASDFVLAYPDFWNLGAGVEQVLPDGRTIRRVSVGVQDAAGNPLGVLVNEYHITLPLDAQQTLGALSAQVRGDLLISIPQARQLNETDTQLGGVPARRMEFIGAASATGASLAAVGVCAHRAGTGYGIIFIGELKALQAYLAFFDAMLVRFEWRLPSAITPEPKPAP